MQNSSDVAVLFAYLNADSVYDRLDEATAHALAKSALATLTSAVKVHAGRVVKTIGDDLIAVFGDAREAAAAAIDMHRGFAPQALAWPDGSQLTIGFAWGPVITDKDGDVFGDTVSIAASANSGPVRKKPGTIVMNRAAFLRLPEQLSAACTLVHSLKMRNGSLVEFYRLPWDSN